jgi:REP element-mobilizing transposase RayT
MKFIPDNIYHVYNQGNNQQRIFFDSNDYITFLNLYKQLFPLHAETIAWCLMPNHFHFMIYTDKRCLTTIKQGGLLIDPVTNSVRKLLSSYARIINKKYERSGSLFRQKTKSKYLADIESIYGKTLDILDYYTNCFYYIHQNPWKSNLVKLLEEWEFSSFRDYAGLRNGKLCNKELAIKYCGYDPNTFYKKIYDDLDKDMIGQFK